MAYAAHGSSAVGDDTVPAVMQRILNHKPELGRLSGTTASRQADARPDRRGCPSSPATSRLLRRSPCRPSIAERTR
jgi:hypothetical protein